MPSRFHALAVLAFTAIAQAALAALPSEIGQMLRTAGMGEEAVGVAVLRARDGAALLLHRAQVPMQPASTMKPLTAIVALDTLGPAYRGRAELLRHGELRGGVLRGELILRGLGDVDLDARALERMLQQARLAGIREVRGDLVVDRSFFPAASMRLGPPHFDETPEFRYNVVPDALMLNGYLVHLELAAKDGRVSAAMWPALADVRVESEMAVTPGACEDWEDWWEHPAVIEHVRGALRLVLRGRFPAGCTASTAVQVIDRDAYVERLFGATWRALGGRFEGRVREGRTPPEAVRLAEHVARPLSLVVHDINKRSDNPTTRVTFHALGTTEGGDGSPAVAAARVQQWMRARGIAVEGLVLENGSGLSRRERIAPAQLAAVLVAARRSPWWPEFLASFPIAGVDGGMRRRLADTPARHARIKTGTLRDASAVAGYLKDAAGEDLVAVVTINHPLASAKVSRPILDAMLEWLARSRLAPPP